MQVITFFLILLSSTNVFAEGYTLTGFWQTSSDSCNMATDSKPIYSSTIEGMKESFEERAGVRVQAYRKFTDGVIFSTKRGEYVLWYKKIDCLDPPYNPLEKAPSKDSVNTNEKSNHQEALGTNTESRFTISAIGLPPNFNCPENIKDPAQRNMATEDFLKWLLKQGESVTIRDVVSYRMEVLRAFHCEKTLKNIQRSEAQQAK